MKLVLSCEHATARVPEEYAGLFAGAPHILETHRGYDIGALEVCQRLEDLAEAAFYGGCSRLLIDLNRSRQHPRLFSCLSPRCRRRQRSRSSPTGMSPSAPLSCRPSKTTWPKTRRSCISPFTRSPRFWTGWCEQTISVSSTIQAAAGKRSWLDDWPGQCTQFNRS